MYPNRNFPPATRRSPKPQRSSPLCPISGPDCRLSDYQETLNELWKVPFAGTSRITKWCTRAPVAGWIIPKFPSAAAGRWDSALGGRWGLFGAAGWDGTLFWSSPKGRGWWVPGVALLRSVPRAGDIVQVWPSVRLWSVRRRGNGWCVIDLFRIGIGLLAYCNPVNYAFACYKLTTVLSAKSRNKRT